MPDESLQEIKKKKGNITRRLVFTAPCSVGCSIFLLFLCRERSIISLSPAGLGCRSCRPVAEQEADNEARNKSEAERGSQKNMSNNQFHLKYRRAAGHAVRLFSLCGCWTETLMGRREGGRFDAICGRREGRETRTRQGKLAPPSSPGRQRASHPTQDVTS